MADIMLVLRLFAIVALATFVARPLALRFGALGGGAVGLPRCCCHGWSLDGCRGCWPRCAFVPFAQASLSGLLVLLALRFALGAPANGRINGRISEWAGGGIAAFAGGPPACSGLVWRKGWKRPACRGWRNLPIWPLCPAPCAAMSCRPSTLGSRASR